jgi:hypothetical protein
MMDKSFLQNYRTVTTQIGVVQGDQDTYRPGWIVADM